jgi:hypothetical protein
MTQDRSQHDESAEPGTPPPLTPLVRKGRLLRGLSLTESSQRGSPPASEEREPTGRAMVKRTIEFEEQVAEQLRHQAAILGVTQNDLANAIIKQAIAALADGRLHAEIGVLPPDQPRGPRASARYIQALKEARPSSEQ